MKISVMRKIGWFAIISSVRVKLTHAHMICKHTHFQCFFTDRCILCNLRLVPVFDKVRTLKKSEGDRFLLAVHSRGQ